MRRRSRSASKGRAASAFEPPWRKALPGSGAEPSSATNDGADLRGCDDQGVRVARADGFSALSLGQVDERLQLTTGSRGCSSRQCSFSAAFSLTSSAF